MKCKECENQTDELVKYRGRKMCPECKECESNEDAWNEDLRRDSMECDEAELMVDNRDLRTKYEREESCHNLTKARLDKHRKMMHDARRALTP